MGRTPAKIVIGALIFPGMDQLDFTGPFEVLSRIPGAQVLSVWKETAFVADMKGLRIVPDVAMSDCPPLDVFVLPGGYGQVALMDDPEVMAFIEARASEASVVLSVCTGALLLGQIGFLNEKHVATHWTALDCLKFYGAIPARARYVVDGKLVSAAGVTSGIDAALKVAELLGGVEIAQALQLYMQYDPCPPFDCGMPDKAPSDVLDRVMRQAEGVTAQRLERARLYAGVEGAAHA